MEPLGQRYVSNELTHFVGRGKNEEEQYQLLIKILNEGWITHPPHELGSSGSLTIKPLDVISSNEMYNPEMVCFCDIPIADLSLHIEKYSPFGLSFSKDFIVRKGGCPVFYLPKDSKVTKYVFPDELSELDQKGTVSTPAFFKDIGKAEYFDKNVQEYHNHFCKIISNRPPQSDEDSCLFNFKKFLDSHIFSYIKFYDHSLSDEHEDNYYLEREWRVICNVNFELVDIQTIFMPREYARRFRGDFPSYISQLIFVS